LANFLKRFEIFAFGDYAASLICFISRLTYHRDVVRDLIHGV